MHATPAVTAVNFGSLHSQSGEARSQHHARHAPVHQARAAQASELRPVSSAPPQNSPAPQSTTPGPAATVTISPQAHDLSPPSAPSASAEPPPSPAAQSYAENGEPVALTGEGGQISHYA